MTRLPSAGVTTGDSALTADEVRSTTFEKSPWNKRGYEEKSVYDFLQLAARRLDGRGHLSAADVRSVGFTKSPLGKRGLDADQVDAMLDRIARTIDAL